MAETETVPEIGDVNGIGRFGAGWEGGAVVSVLYFGRDAIVAKGKGDGCCSQCNPEKNGIYLLALAAIYWYAFRHYNMD